MKRIIWLTFMANLCWVSAQAATLTKVKGNRALISIDGTPLRNGDQFYSLDANGKKRAIIRIVAVKNAQAMGQILKGTAAAGQILMPYVKPVAATKGDAEMSEVPKMKSALSHWGLFASYLINKMSAKFTINGVEKTTDMAGNGFGALAYYDYKVSDAVQLRGSGGLEQFQVSESRNSMDCDKGTSTTCNAIISYLSLYGLAKYNFINGYTKFWFGGGGGYLLAVSKSSTVLDSSQISTNYVATVSGGMDVNMSRGQYLPVVIEYSFFPSSNTVTASYIAFRIGWGWR
jgi:hypothetical protein